MRPNPVIFVIGCTGTGKSDLGVAIAKKYQGEVISLDIATNKITTEEAQGIPHHLMSFLDADSDRFHVHEFRNQALKLIDEIRHRQRIPDNLIEAEGGENEELDSLRDEQLWELLNECDPKSASLVHPNNRFRVRRAVEIYRSTGKTKSEHVREQKKNNGDVDLSTRLRFPNSLVLYLDAAPKVLNERLDSRVEKMKKMGLKDELIDFYKENELKLSDCGAHGVMQCIGLKEFIPWLRLEPEKRESPEGMKLFDQGCEDVKLHTRQYSVRQRRWFVSRLLRRRGENRMESTKMVDTSDKETIISTGLDVVESWLSGTDFREEPPSQGEDGHDANQLIRCEVCDKLIAGKNNWQKHLNGKPHRAIVKRRSSQT
ncbi:unnamed protein product [Caenorhabditis auriculariae]|uniref:U1-type domain-containing protein n=1 Tax=Caenorhabditis auriculariae TaxID=2777116 RepID=A0A8S1GS72_9PELO|nr:unnamed protein product [Caenorhabditis auriculariae]